MLFNSWQFLVFFLMVTAWFYAVPHRFRWPLLLLFSCYFYMVFVPKYILILLVLILIDYFSALIIEPASGSRRKIFLIVSLTANIGMLAFFKYFNFAEDTAVRAFAVFGFPSHFTHWNIILPIGLSFHTFQSMSYTIEVYRGKYPAERHLGMYSLYVLLYPQMVAGPIERPQNLLPQLHTPVAFDANNVIEGVELMLWGLFKKSVIADNLALIVDAAYQHPKAYAGWPIILATYAFAFQIYCDFSGYTDIARGAARAMGYHLMLNFDRPYQAQSIVEFWRRWHISLSTWFRDYLYFPLGGNRRGSGRYFFNILIVFLVSGLWHGASWAFVVWGALHGTYIIVGQFTKRLREQLWSWAGLAKDGVLRIGIATICTFHLVWAAWVFFRAGSLHQAATVFASMLSFTGSPFLLPGELGRLRLAAVAISMLVIAGVHQIQRRYKTSHLAARFPAPLRMCLFLLGGLWVVLWGRFASQEFIYFQF